MGILDQAKQWMTPERAIAMQGIGMGLSQLGAGQPVNMSPAYQALQQRQQQAQLRKVMEQPGLMDGFSPQQRAVLATMPEDMAVQIIMQRAFAAPRDPIEINGQLVDPTTMKVLGDFRTPEAPKPIEINGQLVDPVTRQVIGDYRDPAEPKQTDDMAEYAFALEQGYQGSLADWILEQRKAGAPSNTVINAPAGVPANADYTKKRNEGYAAQMQEIEEQEGAARRALSSLDVMKNQMADPGFYSGSGAEAVLQLRRAGAALGLADPEGIDSMETFNAQAKAAALEVMGGSLGTGFSNADRDFVEQQVPNLQSTPQGNAKLIEVQSAIQKRKLAIARRAREYEAKNGQIDQGFFTELQQWADANPIFKAEPAPKQPPISVDGYTIQQVD